MQNNSARRGPGPIRGRRKRGVSLIEMMVAITILLITVAGTTASQVSSNRLIATSAETSAAMADLQTCMEQLLLMPPEELPVAGSPYAAGQPVAAFEDMHLEGERIIARYPGFAGGAVPDPLEILLTITWRDHQGGTRTLQLPCLTTR